MEKYDNKIVSARIQKQRKKLNLTQDQLADMIGLKRSNISGYENGRIIPPSNVLYQLAEIFKVSTDYLFGRSVPSNNKVEFEKQFIIKYDVINDQVTYDNPDNLSFLEVMGMLGITNLMIAEEWSEE